jgi:hypothetical protein
MPNVWAHIQFGREVLEAVDERSRLDHSPWRTAFQLGCQGPDFLFYDHFLPWQSATSLNKLGSLMHNIHCGPFLLSLFEEIRAYPLEHPAVAYALGFLLHHVLDRHLHPFVFSLSGFKKWHHQRFETAMDSVVLSVRAGIHTGTTPVGPEVDTQGRLPGDIAEGFLRAVSIHYPILAEKITAMQLDGAVAQFVAAQRIFFDPSGWKGKLLFGQIAPFSPPSRVPEWDVLNTSRQPWIDPTDRTVVHRESAFELWDQALFDGVGITRTALSWLQAGESQDAAHRKEAFAGLLGNVSYETGLPCGEATITFADSIVPE